MARLSRVAGVAAAAAALGYVVDRTMIASPRYRGPESDHFDGRCFHNHRDGWQTEGS